MSRPPLLRARPGVFCSSLAGLAALLSCGGTRERVIRDCPAQSDVAESTPEAPAAAPAPFQDQAIAPEGEHPFSVLDLLALDRISDPQVSPDGTKIAFAVRKTDLAENRGRQDLWVIGLDGSGPVQLTTDPENESSPRWAPDSQTLYFLAKHAGKQQIWRVAVGEAPTVMTRFPVDVAAIELSPDGRTLAFAADVFPECEGKPEGALECTAARLEERAKKENGTGTLYTKLFVRHWDAWKDGRRSQLFAWKVGGGAPVHVSRGIDGDVPSKPFGSMDEVAFTPDSSGLVFAARIAGASEPWSTNFDLFHAAIEGPGAPKNLTEGNAAWDTEPTFSPDGKTLAYLAMSRPGFEADRFRVVLRPWPEGQERILTADWDRSVEEIQFSPDGKTLYAVAQDTGHTPLFALDLASGAPRKLVPEGAVHNLGFAGDKLVFLRNSMQHPDELFTSGPEGQDVQRLTRWNDAKLARARLGKAEQFSFPGAKNETVYGWIVRPPEVAEGAKIPVAFLIHGGPQGSFGDRWNYRWNPQTYAGAGYAAVMIDFHGSTGYGQAFTDAIQDDWGGKPLVDLQKGLAAALAKDPTLDGSRVCALGASYGGFMVNWIASQWPEAFKCLVNHDGVFDNRMMYYATEELWFPEWEHGGPYWKFKDRHELHNPANYVDRWRLPMLVIHGGLDYRISDTQGIATFTALQRRGIPSRLLHFPDENHWVLKPANSKVWHDTVIGWLDTWLKP